MSGLKAVRKYGKFSGNNPYLRWFKNEYVGASTKQDRDYDADRDSNSHWAKIRDLDGQTDGSWDYNSYPTGVVSHDEYISGLTHEGFESAVALYGDYEVLTYLDLKKSSNTVGWFGMKDARLQTFTLTKGNVGNNRPKAPVRHEPRLYRGTGPKPLASISLSMIPPTRKPGEGLPAFELRLEQWTSAKKRKEEKLNFQRELKYQALLRKHRERVSKSAKRQSDFDKAYDLRLKKYQLKLKEYEDGMARALKPRFAQGASKPILPDNPYSRITVIPVGQMKMMYGYFQRYQYWYDAFIEPKTGETIPGYILYGRSMIASEVLTRNHQQSSDEAFLAMQQQIVKSAEPYLKDIDGRLRGKIHSKLKKSSVHVGNLLAERKQTYELIATSLTRIIDLIKAKRRIFAAAGRYVQDPKAIADDVLAFKFGVEPLMSDIKKAIDYIDSSEDNPTIVARVNHGSPVAFEFNDGKMSFSGTVEMSYVLKCRVSNPAARALSQFGLINPLEIAWEVLPWSFIVDWFLPVGDWLSNQTADCGLELMSGTRKVKLVGRFLISANPDFSKHHNGQFTGIHGEFDGSVIERTVLTDLPAIPMPVVKNPWSWSHGIEAVALAVQRLKKQA